MGLGSELVAEYVIDNKPYFVYGCWDEITRDNEYDFFDVYCEGECINLGSPFWEKPTVEQIKNFLRLKYLSNRER